MCLSNTEMYVCEIRLYDSGVCAALSSNRTLYSVRSAHRNFQQISIRLNTDLWRCKSGITLLKGSREIRLTVPLKLIYPALTQQGNTAACYRALNSEGFLPLPPLEVKMKIKVVFFSYLHSVPSLNRVYANRAENRDNLTQRGTHCLQTVYVLDCGTLNMVSFSIKGRNNHYIF